MRAPRFPVVYCSQCGGEFGPGESGFSHCSDHGLLRRDNKIETCLDPRDCASGNVPCTRVLFGRQRCADADAIGTQP